MVSQPTSITITLRDLAGNGVCEVCPSLEGGVIDLSGQGESQCEGYKPLKLEPSAATVCSTADITIVAAAPFVMASKTLSAFSNACCHVDFEGAIFDGGAVNADHRRIQACPSRLVTYAVEAVG